MKYFSLKITTNKNTCALYRNKNVLQLRIGEKKGRIENLHLNNSIASLFKLKAFLTII